jgi:predicted lipopolysaccharide heptosyltransferase III
MGVKKILVINLAWIGDVVLATPVYRALRSAFPLSEIHLLVVPNTAGIAQCSPFVDKVLIYDKRGRHKKLKDFFRLVRSLRQQVYDLSVATNFALRAPLMGWLAGAKHRAGYDAQHGRWFLSHVASSQRSSIRHETENQLAVLEPLGVSGKDTSLELVVSKTTQRKVDGMLSHLPALPLVALCPFGRYAQKNWSKDECSSAVRQLSAVANCCLIGGEAEAEGLAEINQRSGAVAVEMGGKLTLEELTALLVRARVLISVDTAPVHIAQAVGTPVVTLFGPTDPRIWGPRGEQDVVLTQPLDCSPCHGEIPCKQGRCECLDHIGADTVVHHTLRMLKKKETDTHA